MASLYNNKISATYVGLIKTLDSAVINATLRELSDGLGNQTGLFINTSGDFKATGILEFGSLKDTGENITITKFVDEADGIANNDNDTTIPTSAAIIDYVASQVTLEDLDFSGDSGSGSVDLDSQTFAIVGTANEIETSASGQQLQIGLPSSISVNLVGNVTGDLTGNVTGDLTGNVTATSVLADGVTATTQAYGDNSTKVATTAYVDAQVTAEDLDFAGDSGTGSVDLDSQSLSITGTTNQVTTSATNQTLNISLPSTVHRNLQGDVTGDLTGNVTGNVTGNLTGDVTGDVTGNLTGDVTGDVTGIGTLSDGSTAVTQSQGDNSTKIATTAYVDAGLSDQDTLAEVLAVGNTTGGTDIAVSAGDDITFADNSSAYFGNANDFQIYHDSTSNNSFIKETGVGSLQIWCKDFEVYNAGGTETLINADVNAGVQLYYDNLVKFATVSSGVDITGDLDVSGEVSVGADDSIFDNNTLRFKSSGNAFIDHNTVGQSLYIRTSNASSLDTNAVIIASDGDIDLSGSLTIAQDLTVNGTTTTVNTETLAVEDPLISMAKDNAANSVDIGFYGRYNDGSNRYLGLYADASDTNTFKLFKGTTTEPTTTVDSTATGYTLANLDVNVLDAQQVYSLDMLINDYVYHNGDTNTYFGFPSNDNFVVSTGGNTNLAISSSTVTLKHSGTTKLETTAGGVSITGTTDSTGTITVTGASSNIRVGTDTGKFLAGASNDLQIYHDGSNSIVQDSGTGDLRLAGNVVRIRNAADTENMISCVENGAVTLAYDNSTKLQTTSTGITVTGDITIDAGKKLTYNSNSFMTPENNVTGAEISTAGDFRVKTGTTPTLGLTIGGTQDASFAGNVTINKASNPTKLQIGSSLADDPFIHFQTDSENYSIGVDRSDSNKFKISNGSDVATNTRVTMDTSGQVGLGISPTAKLQVDTGVSSLNQGIPATSGTSQNGILRLTPGAGTYGEALDIGMNVGTTYAWIQSTNKDNLGVNYNLALNPNGGNVGIQHSSPEKHLSIGSAQGEGIQFTYDGTNNYRSQILTYWNSSVDSRMDFNIARTSGQTPETIMSVGYNSNVGVGTQTPSTPVEIVSDQNTLLYANSSTATVYLRLDDANSTNGNFIGATGDNMHFWTNNTKAAEITGQQEVISYNDFIIDNASPEMYFKTGGTHYRWMVAAQENIDAALEITPSTTVGGSTYSTPVAVFKATGEVGIGATPAASGDPKLRVASKGQYYWTSGNGLGDFHVGSGTYGLSVGVALGGAGAGDTRIWTTGGTNVMEFATNDVARFRIDGSGNMSIYNGQTLNFLNSINSAGGAITCPGGGSLSLKSYGNEMIGLSEDTRIVFSVGSASEKMRINGTGDILFGTQGIPNGTSVYGSAFINDTNNAMVLKLASSISTAKTLIQFLNPNGSVGSIQTNASATSYVTSSDYRLKEDLQDFNGLDKISQIPVYDFKWKSDGTRSYGVIAHELQEVLPQAVTGEKDATEEYEITPAVLGDKGSVIEEAVMGTRDAHQGVDYSKIVPLLVKSIQELKAEIEELKRK